MIFDIPGQYVWHCHILSHEDHMMIRELIVASDLTAQDYFNKAKGIKSNNGQGNGNTGGNTGITTGGNGNGNGNGNGKPKKPPKA